MSGSKLRYAAYEPPQVAPRLRRGSSSQLSTSSSSSTYSDHGLALDQRQSLDELSKTVTAGDLALAAGDIALDGPKVSCMDLVLGANLIFAIEPFHTYASACSQYSDGRLGM